MKKAVSGVMLTLLLIGMITLAFDIQSVTSELTKSDWPISKHNTARTGYNAEETVLSPPLTLKWVFKSATRDVFQGISSANGVVYVSMQGWVQAWGDSNKVYAIDAATGMKKWEFILDEGRGSMDCTPAIANDLIYFGGQNDDKLYALYAETGQIAWEFRGIGTMFCSHPLVVDGVVYAMGMDKLYALDAQTGAKKWEFPVAGQGRCSPAVKDSTLYIGSSDGFLYALDATTGSLKWSSPYSSRVFSYPLVSNGIVYIEASNNVIKALDATTGSLKWEVTLEEEMHFLSEGNLALAYNTLYVSVWKKSDGHSKLYALDALTGSRKWCFDAGEVYFLYTPAVANGIVYVSSFQGGTLYALDAMTGVEKWRCSHGWLTSPPIIANGVLYVANYDTLYAYGHELAKEPDFTISEIKPVQVVWNNDINNDGKIDLVAGKSTMVRVIVGMENYEALDKTTVVEVDLIVPEYATDNVIVSRIYTAYPTIEQLEQNNKIIDFYILPPALLGDYEITAIIDPHNNIEESNEANNERRKDVTIYDNNELKMEYFRVQSVWPANYGTPTQEEYLSTVEHNHMFMTAAYPISESELRMQDAGVYFGDPIPLLGMLDDLISLSTWAWILGANRGVGIVSDAYFPYHGQNVNTVGIAHKDIKGAVLVREGFWTAAAHEIGHTYGLCLDVEEYVANPPGNQADGFWVSEHKEISNGICFMGFAPPKHEFEREGRHIWVDNNHYGELFRTFKTGEDPEVLGALFIRGIVYRNGTLGFKNMYLLEGAPIECPLPGDYSIQLVSAEEQVISEISFDASFKIYIDPIGIAEMDAAGFAFSVPWDVRTDKIRIIYNGMVLGEKQVTRNCPTVQVVYPNGGELLPGLATHTITWKAYDADNDELTYSLLFSEDGGVNWKPLALDLTETRYCWNISGLPTGSNYLIRVIASDGINTGIDDSDNTFTILAGWTHAFRDEIRETELRINTEEKTFQFITPDKDYGIREATYMRQCGRTIIIQHCDNELRLITAAVDTKLDFCVAIAWDQQTSKRYFLIDKVGNE